MKRVIPIRRSRAADWARLTGGLAVPVLALSAVGARIGLVPDMALLPVLSCGFLLALLALGLGTYALSDVWNSGADGARSAIAGLVYATPALALLGLIAAAALAYPRLTDVSTDVLSPPIFTGPAAPRGRPGPESAALQAKAYPDIAPRTYALSLAEVYFAARHVMDDRGWSVIRDTRPATLQEEAPSPAPPPIADEELIRALAGKRVVIQSRSEVVQEPPQRSDSRTGTAGAAAERPVRVVTIEAAAPTPVFGFVDDVVVRLRATADGTRVDMRSASRAGEHDLGQNGRRIKAFFADLEAALQPSPDAPGSRRGVASVGQ